MGLSMTTPAAADFGNDLAAALKRVAEIQAELDLASRNNVGLVAEVGWLLRRLRRLLRLG